MPFCSCVQRIYCFVVGEGKEHFNISQDAMLVHTLSMMFCRGQGR